MTTIQIAHDVSDDTIARIKSLLDSVAHYNVNFNGADFIIERGDFTCIPDDESADAAVLLNDIYRVIDDEE